MSVPVSPTPEPRRAVLLTAQEWCEALGWHILDPDGWRTDGLSWLALITREDFERRAAASTAHGPGYWPAAPVSSPTPDEQAAEEEGPRYAHRLTGMASMWDAPSCTCGWTGGDFWRHLHDAVLADVDAALVVVREQLTQAETALVEIAHLHREVKNPYQEATGSPGVCSNCSSWAYFTDGMGASVTWPCPTAALVPPPSPPTYTTEEPTP